MKFLKMLKSLFQPVPRVAPAEAADAIRSGDAVLVDVREPAEWRGGVAAAAALLPLSDLTGARKRWKDFLETVRERHVLLYCASGGRSALAARLLAGEGYRVANAGGLSEWAAAGWPVIDPERAGGPANAVQKRKRR